MAQCTLASPPPQWSHPLWTETPRDTTKGQSCAEVQLPRKRHAYNVKGLSSLGHQIIVNNFYIMQMQQGLGTDSGITHEPFQSGNSYFINLCHSFNCKIVYGEPPSSHHRNKRIQQAELNGSCIVLCLAGHHQHINVAVRYILICSIWTICILCKCNGFRCLTCDPDLNDHWTKIYFSLIFLFFSVI